jgi:hypothetical protein
MTSEAEKGLGSVQAVAALLARQTAERNFHLDLVGLIGLRKDFLTAVYFPLIPRYTLSKVALCSVS